ncbi:MAG: hypothetical protein NTW31_01605 [Bacteroidetes bacterium]|nr:hypothetical protein [Bacteroidota bacterium]
MAKNSPKMRKIKLENYSTPEKSATYQKQRTYRLWLGNDVTVCKTSEKAIITAITAVNDELNNYLAEINQMYIDYFAMYRRRWFILDPENGNKEIEKNVRNCLNEIDRYLNLIVERYSFPNGNHFVFKHLNCIFNEFQNILTAFIQVDTKKNNYGEIQSLKANIKRVNSLQKEMNSLGSDY